MNYKNVARIYKCHIMEQIKFAGWSDRDYHDYSWIFVSKEIFKDTLASDFWIWDLWFLVYPAMDMTCMK